MTSNNALKRFVEHRGGPWFIVATLALSASSCVATRGFTVSPSPQVVPLAQSDAVYERLVAVVREWAAARQLKQGRCRFNLEYTRACEVVLVPFEACGLVSCSTHHVEVAAVQTKSPLEVRLLIQQYGGSRDNPAWREAESSLVPMVRAQFKDVAVLIEK